MDNIRDALGGWLGGWYGQLSPVTRQMHEYCNRGLSQSMAFVPGRMIDSAEDMLNLWIRNDTDSAPTKAMKLPVALLAVATEATPTGRDWGKGISDGEFVVLGNDIKERVFKLRTALKDVRCQLLFVAHEGDTTEAMATQFALWLDGYSQRNFDAAWQFAGLKTLWPVSLETTDVFPSRIATASKNLSMVTVDFTLKVTQPLFTAPRANEPNDGKGTTQPDGIVALDDPHGYPTTASIVAIPSILPGALDTGAKLGTYVHAEQKL